MGRGLLLDWIERARERAREKERQTQREKERESDRQAQRRRLNQVSTQSAAVVVAL